jgi:hypothetical protein
LKSSCSAWCRFSAAAAVVSSRLCGLQGLKLLDMNLRELCSGTFLDVNTFLDVDVGVAAAARSGRMTLM